MKDKTCMPEMTEDGIRLLTTQEAAEYMGISYRQFLKIRKRGYCGLPTYPAPPCTMIGKNKKKFRQGEEYGSARWGGEKDIEPYMDSRCFENNVLLTQTERLTMGKPYSPKPQICW